MWGSDDDDDEKTLRHTFAEMKKASTVERLMLLRHLICKLRGWESFFYSSLKGENFNIHEKRDSLGCVREPVDEIAVVKRGFQGI